MSLAGGVTSFGRAGLRYVRHGAALIGLVLVVLVWVSVNLFLESERSTAEQAAVRNATNLLGALEEHLARSLDEIDRSLRIVRARYLRNAGDWNYAGALKTTELFNTEIIQFGIIGPDGRMKHSSRGDVQLGGIDYSDREHFQVHRNRHSDELFISKPVIGRASGKWSIELTRRIENPDGSFGGVIVASLDPAYLTRVYSAVNAGADGIIRLIGADGIVRASSRPEAARLGQDLSGGLLFKLYQQQASGWRYLPSHLSDGIPRLVAFRGLKNYPLIISIGQSTRELCFSRPSGPMMPN